MDEFKVPILPSSALIRHEVVFVEKPPEPPPLPPLPPQQPKASPPQVGSGCPYKAPEWSEPPNAEQSYRFEVLKSGQIIDEVKELQQQAVWTFGRLNDNDVAMAHPTISRYHCVLQYKPRVSRNEDEQGYKRAIPDEPEGWYIYDMGSTHGTFLNKQRLPTHVYIRMRVGHMLKLGSSTRVYILQGPSEDEEPESELTVTELREQREQLLAADNERKALAQAEHERNDGASWGMSEDADEESDLTHNPYASTNNEELFFDDPKRTLRGYFEREGLNLEYKCDELSTGSFVCRVELPLDDSNGRPIVVEVTHKGRKKDCVVQCALEACRTLDRHGVLRQANQESQKRKILKQDNSDDEDEFWDRTGDVARKKQRKAGNSSSVTLTYDDLLKQQSELNAERQKIDSEIFAYQLNEKRLKELAIRQQNASDDLDNFMDTLVENVPQVDKTEIKKLRLEEQRIKGEQEKLERLIKIAKPTALPFASTSRGSMSTVNKEQEGSISKKQLPMIGKRNQFSKFKVIKAQTSIKPKVETSVFGSDDEEVEEEEEDLKAETVTKPSTSKESKEMQSTVESEVKPNKIEATAEAADKSDVVKSIEATAEVSADKEETAAGSSAHTHTDVASGSAEQQQTKADVEADSEAAADAHADADAKAAADAETEEAAHKKRRQRARQRNKQQRPDVDMDLNELAEHEDSDKYAKWVPPSNQSGDGFTHLNDKFGY